ncbi:unnamed protein product [Notodromas monacha]|uniref:SCP domain-containing protein n=1 Tax=Notodromas monacha TaxID=399045 RepID=A0A7R9BR62_9CRUS|nr:unnamed protein product [Notodromas monacha]CAG0920144.1 unnamed protein product [Notodromas monacha]
MFIKKLLMTADSLALREMNFFLLLMTADALALREMNFFLLEVSDRATRMSVAFTSSCKMIEFRPQVIFVVILIACEFSLCAAAAEQGSSNSSYTPPEGNEINQDGVENTTNIAAESDSFKSLRRNLFAVLASLPKEVASNDNVDELLNSFQDLIKEYKDRELDELQPIGDKTRRVPYGSLHKRAHELIDDTNLSPNTSQFVHRDIFFTFTNSYSSNVCYEKYAKNHTGCLRESGFTGCEKIVRGVEKEDEELIVDLHNEYRSKMAKGEVVINGTRLRPAAAMAKMVWDRELASLAQAWADQCNFTTDCIECRRTDRLRFVGQNVVRFKGLKSAHYRYDWRMAIGAWADTMNALPVDTDVLSNYEHDNKWASYTQMIWDYTYLVGCGFSYYEDKEFGGFTQFYVCNYGPAGNVVGGQVYESGPGCSNCPPSHKCVLETELCSYDEEDSPEGFQGSSLFSFPDDGSHFEVQLLDKHKPIYSEKANR